MIRYAADVVDILPSQLPGFFEGWPNPPSSETHLRLLQSSSHVVIALADSHQVVGFVTAISDGVLSAYVPFLEVLPSHRGRGIGQELIRRVLVQLRDIYSINLHCDPELRSFYEHLGMRSLGGMAIRNYENQSGAHAV
jgi:ribosomal protein S18 acetylase RimI-like enzyme